MARSRVLFSPPAITDATDNGSWFGSGSSVSSVKFVVKKAGRPRGSSEPEEFNSRGQRGSAEPSPSREFGHKEAQKCTKTGRPLFVDFRAFLWPRNSLRPAEEGREGGWEIDRFLPIIEGVGKTSEQAAADAVRDDSPAMGMTLQIEHRSVEFLQKVGAESGALPLVVECGGGEFAFRFEVKDDPHRAAFSAARTAADACS